MGFQEEENVQFLPEDFGGTYPICPFPNDNSYQDFCIIENVKPQTTFLVVGGGEGASPKSPPPGGVSSPSEQFLIPLPEECFLSIK